MRMNVSVPIRLVARQTGTALVAGLVFLVILVMLGLSASSAAIQQEIAVRNIRDENLAFQAAEAALQTAETWIRNNNGPVPTSIAGMINGHAAIHEDSFCDGSTTCEYATGPWWNANAILVSSDKTNPVFPGSDIAEQPAYVIEFIPLSGPSLSMNNDTSSTRAYRITARGVGMNPNTVRIVRSIYRYG